jgi:large subunit ribosomal protein L7/L12
MPQTKEDIVSAIKQLSVLDLVDLVKTLEKEFGVSAAAPVAAASVATPTQEEGSAPVAVVEEPTEFNAILVEVTDPGKKIAVIKAVRELTALGLREAKAVVDEAPKPIKENITKEEAEAIKAKMTEAGASVEIKPAS